MPLSSSTQFTQIYLIHHQVQPFKLNLEGKPYTFFKYSTRLLGLTTESSA